MTLSSPFEGVFFFSERIDHSVLKPRARLYLVGPTVSECYSCESKDKYSTECQERRQSCVPAGGGSRLLLPPVTEALYLGHVLVEREIVCRG